MDLCGDTSGCAFVLVNPRVRLVQTPEGVLMIRPPRLDIHGGCYGFTADLILLGRC